MQNAAFEGKAEIRLDPIKKIIGRIGNDVPSLVPLSEMENTGSNLGVGRACISFCYEVLSTFRQ